MKSKINPLLAPYLAKDYGVFDLKYYSENLVAIYHKGFRIGLFGINQKTQQFEFLMPDAEYLFKFNSYGVLLDVLESELPFERMRFKDRDSFQVYETTRDNFLTYGKNRKWSFGVKRNLHISFFKEIKSKKGVPTDASGDQLSLDFKVGVENEE